MAQRQLEVLVVADGEPLVAGGLALLLEAHSRVRVAAAHDLPTAGRRLSESAPDAVLLFADDVDAALAAWVRERRSEHACLAFSLLISSADPTALRTLVAGAAGHIGLVLRADRLDAQGIFRSLREAAEGRATLDGYQLELLGARREARAGRLRDLTDHEREVLRLLAVGLRNRVIARRLWTSENAVEKSVTQIFSKLGLSGDAASRLDRRVAATGIYLAEQAVERERRSPAPVAQLPRTRAT